MSDQNVPMRKGYQPESEVYYDGLQPTEDNLNLNDPPGRNIEPTSQDSGQSGDLNNDS